MLWQAFKRKCEKAASFLYAEGGSPCLPWDGKEGQMKELVIAEWSRCRKNFVIASYRK